jgi:hypothetical protein
MRTVVNAAPCERDSQECLCSRHYRPVSFCGAADGVGITRFLAMLAALSHVREEAAVFLVLSTRDPGGTVPTCTPGALVGPAPRAPSAPRRVQDVACAGRGVDEKYSQS